MIPFQGAPGAKGAPVPPTDDWFAQNAPPPAAPTGGPSQPQGGAYGDPEAFGAAWKASGGRTVADLQAFVQQHPEYGVSLFGSKGDKLRFPNGYEYDGVLSAGAGGLGATFDRLNGGDAGGGMGGIGNGAFLTPYDKEFKLPTYDELQAMPGYQAGLQAAQQGVERGAAAKGTLLTGGTQQAIANRSVDYANQQYGNLAALANGVQNLNYGVFKDNQDRPFSKLSDMAKLGQPR